jgi:hypothetical protein
VAASWDECSPVTQALIVAFYQIDSHDAFEREAAFAGVDTK